MVQTWRGILLLISTWRRCRLSIWSTLCSHSDLIDTLFCLLENNIWLFDWMNMCLKAFVGRKLVDHCQLCGIRTSPKGLISICIHSYDKQTNNQHIWQHPELTRDNDFLIICFFCYSVVVNVFGFVIIVLTFHNKRATQSAFFVGMENLVPTYMLYVLYCCNIMAAACYFNQIQIPYSSLGLQMVWEKATESVKKEAIHCVLGFNFILCTIPPPPGQRLWAEDVWKA